MILAVLLETRIGLLAGWIGKLVETLVEMLLMHSALPENSREDLAAD